MYYRDYFNDYYCEGLQENMSLNIVVPSNSQLRSDYRVFRISLCSDPVVLNFVFVRIFIFYLNIYVCVS